jgi:hypothetical protein
MPLRFGCGKVGNVLRPFVYFNRPRKMDLGMFIQQNPTLGEITDNFNMTQKKDRAKQLDPIFDIHELTRHFLPGRNGRHYVVPYVQYFCATLNLYSHLCLGGNQEAIKAIIECGVDESHILCALCPDSSRLTVHELMKQQYIQLAKALYIDNEPARSGVSVINRVYSWKSLGVGE